LVYARHILEHLDYYEKALTEMIRVSKRAVIHTFFRRPMDEPDLIEIYSKETQLYQNAYNKQKIENFLSKNERIIAVEWVRPDILKHDRWYNGEVLLHIHLK
jgi:ubiquinone/menaquinone biosynthesis C-methylase UbiE